MGAEYKMILRADQATTVFYPGPFTVTFHGPEHCGGPRACLDCRSFARQNRRMRRGAERRWVQAPHGGEWPRG